jgi:hypothetical protein
MEVWGDRDGGVQFHHGRISLTKVGYMVESTTPRCTNSERVNQYIMDQSRPGGVPTNEGVEFDSIKGKDDSSNLT